MDKESIDTSRFKHKKVFCNQEFEDILAGIITCYHSIISNKIPLPSNDENHIRDIILYEYLKNKKFKDEHYPLYNYQFDLETFEKDGRVDIRILSINPYLGDYEYYIIECKRLDNKNQDGISGLNGKYISEGIVRIVSGIYPTYKKTAGMIGFIVAKINIDQNIKSINRLLKILSNTNVQQELKKKEISLVFDFSYCSSHIIKNEAQYIYHLMFDFSNNIIECS